MKSSYWVFHVLKSLVFIWIFYRFEVLLQAELLRYVTLKIDDSLNFSEMRGYTNYQPYEAVLLDV